MSTLVEQNAGESQATMRRVTAAMWQVAPPPLEPTHEQVARRAYLLWRWEGCPDHRADDHWWMAESLLRAERQQRYGQRPDHAGSISRARIAGYRPVG